MVGVDGINTKIIKSIIDVTLEPLVDIVNNILLGEIFEIFPNELQISKIIPINSKGAIQSIENYRPISILLVRANIIEMVIHN